MCGICGIYNFGSGQPVEGDMLQRMRDVMRHRGPDEEGLYLEGNLGLGHRRLNIIDLSTGQQPMCNEDGTIWIVYNGEVYNFPELREDLSRKGHLFKTRSDTEVIIHAYEEYGPDCVQKLRGAFAFALWDERERCLMLARDRMGIKPLSYLMDDNRLVFASEIKAILEAEGVRRELDLAALDSYLKYQYVPAPQTIFAGLKKLPPGHVLVHKNGRTTIHRYWDLRFGAEGGAHPEEYYRERLLELLREAVKIRLMSDVPLGAFLSGGIDSSTVVALMSQVMDQPVKTFSVGFEEEDFSELRHARMVAERFGTDHHEFVVRPDALEVLPRLVWQFDEPFADSSAIPTYYVSRLAREYVTVCLSGDGGDETFAGYNRYEQAVKEHRRLDWLPLTLRRVVFGTMHRLLPEYVKGKGLTRRASLSPTGRYIEAVSIFPEQSRLALLTDEVRSELRDGQRRFLQGYFDQAQGLDYLSQLQYVDTMTYLPEDGLVKVDRTSMLNSLETRVPLLDHEVLEFAATIPAELKMQGYERKYILKKTMEGLVPDEILYRRKMGFGVPLRHWFRKELHDYAKEVLLDRRTSQRGLFNRACIESILNNHQRGMRDFSAKIWALLFFEEWYRCYLDR